MRWERFIVDAKKRHRGDRCEAMDLAESVGGEELMTENSFSLVNESNGDLCSFSTGGMSEQVVIDADADPPDNLQSEHVVDAGEYAMNFSFTGGSEYSPSLPGNMLHEAPLQEETNVQATVTSSEWNCMVASCFTDYRTRHSGLLLPWETGTCADIFSDDFVLELPTCLPLPELQPVGNSNDLEGNLLGDRDEMPIDAKYVHVVQSVKDLEYFESKAMKLDKACAQWMQILSVNWGGFRSRTSDRRRSSS